MDFSVKKSKTICGKPCTVYVYGNDMLRFMVNFAVTGDPASTPNKHWKLKPYADGTSSLMTQKMVPFETTDEQAEEMFDDLEDELTKFLASITPDGEDVMEISSSMWNMGHRVDIDGLDTLMTEEEKAILSVK